MERERMNQKQLGKAYTAIRKFNDIAGQLENVTKDSIALQLDLIQEEYLETVDEYDLENPVGILDGAIDMFVVVSGLLLKLDASGYDVATAMKRITDNNLSKYPSAVNPTIPVPVEWNSEWTLTHNKEHEVLVWRDGNNKIRKPHGFRPVEIGDCIGEWFK
jgi:hypothetical protein